MIYKSTVDGYNKLFQINYFITENFNTSNLHHWFKIKILLGKFYRSSKEMGLERNTHFFNKRYLLYVLNVNYIKNLQTLTFQYKFTLGNIYR